METKGEKINNELCKHCNNSFKDFVWVCSYWKPYLQFKVHKECKIEYMNFERISCQNIDKSCNDCKYFKSDNQKYKGFRKGLCLKKNIKRTAFSNYCYDDTQNCFEHREQQH